MFLGFDQTPKQQVFAELAEMIKMRGGDPADVFSGIFPAEWPRVECALPRVVSNEGVVIEGVALSLPRERVRLICLDHEGARHLVLGWPAWKSTSLCRGALVRDAAGVLRRAELFTPDDRIGDCLTVRLIDEPDGVVTFVGFKEHATVDESSVRMRAAGLNGCGGLTTECSGKSRGGAPGEAGATTIRGGRAETPMPSRRFTLALRPPPAPIPSGPVNGSWVSCSLCNQR